MLYTCICSNTHILYACCYIYITLWIPATPSEYHSTAYVHLFGLACCTVCVIIHETCKAIIQKFKYVCISFSTGKNLKTVIGVFKTKKSGIFLSVVDLLMAHI